MAPRPVIVAAAVSALTLILWGCGDSCQADVEAALQGVGTAQCNGTDADKAMCECGNEKAKLEVFDNMISCNGNTEWFPGNQQTQRLNKERECCDHVTIFGQDQEALAEAEYDKVNPPSIIEFCAIYQQALDRVIAAWGDCGDNDRKELAKRGLQIKLDVSCTQAMQAEKEAVV